MDAVCQTCQAIRPDGCLQCSHGHDNRLGNLGRPWVGDGGCRWQRTVERSDGAVFSLRYCYQHGPTSTERLDHIEPAVALVRGRD